MVGVRWSHGQRRPKGNKLDKAVAAFTRLQQGCRKVSHFPERAVDFFFQLSFRWVLAGFRMVEVGVVKMWGKSIFLGKSLFAEALSCMYTVRTKAKAFVNVSRLVEYMHNKAKRKKDVVKFKSDWYIFVYCFIFLYVFFLIF